MRNRLCILFITIILLTTTFGTTSYSSYNQNKKNNFESLEITAENITGGFLKIKVDIKNTGQNQLTDLEWNMAVKGGIFNKINSSNSGAIQDLEAGEKQIIESKPVFGIGEIVVKVSVGDFEKSYKGSVYLFLIKIQPGLTIKLDKIADGFTSPIAMDYPNDDSNRLFIADQTGKIFIIKNNELLSQPFMDISDKIVDLDPNYDERGLLGLAFHPDYKDNGRFFLYYSAPTEKQGINHESILSEFKVSNNNPDIADENSEKIIMKIDEPEANHNGGQLKFGPDNYLYIAVGDGGGAGDDHGEIGNGQNISTLLGSILRIDVDSDTPYGIPNDNPFLGKKGRDEIFAYGLRNPWRFSFDLENDNFVVADVGQDKWEEINFVEKGKNYGWRIMEGKHPYDPGLAEKLNIDMEELEKPIHEYSHSVGKSITGGYFYKGKEITALQDKYVFGDWSNSFFNPDGKLYYLEEVEPNIWKRFQLIPEENFNKFILSLAEDSNGELYVLSKDNLGPSGSSGRVSKIIK
ncbi:MAG: PQQ-dependent sugar dehydrogenase [Candidatus Thermoplasmatota archaeon]